MYYKLKKHTHGIKEKKRCRTNHGRRNVHLYCLQVYRKKDDCYYISTLPSTDVNSYSFEGVMSLVMKHREKELLDIEKKAVKDFGDKIIDKDVLSKLRSNGQTVKRSNG